MALFNQHQQTVLADQHIDNPYTKVNVHFKPNTALGKLVKRDFRNHIISKGRSERKILFSHFGNRAWLDLEVKADKRIARFYGYDLHRLPHESSHWTDRYLRLFERVDSAIVEGPFMKDSLKKMGCPEEKLTVLPLGVLVDEAFTLRQNGGTPQILIAGAFKEKKGILTALKSCQLLLEAGFDLYIHLVGSQINATENDRIYAEKVLKKMKAGVFKERLLHHGFVTREQLREIATKCHIALQPSQWASDRDCEGGFPVTFLDLMSTGLPIVSTNHCDIPFAVNNKNGAICAEKDIEGLATAVKMILRDENLAERSRAAYQTVKDKFNWEVLKPLYHQNILK